MSLVLASQRKLYLYILSLVLYPSDADDLLQDTLVLMWSKFDEFKPGSDFTAWGKAIARFKVLNHLKKNKSAKLQFDEDLLKVIEAESSQTENLDERIEVMRKCVQSLSEKEMNLLRMRYYLDFSFKKIALSIGISKQSVYRAVSRIHAKLVKCMRLNLRMSSV
ncbi:MAG TPA: sigma-70 family RNA polymerase sigma factor [Anaerohalosphaeraceae bacterium]|nr:sigma-70 family RNA polymerase sigma factor [Anaerohalosphaeraceae bacterium]HOL90076.1 sigma-70 family RNA polymerase sigma factor [Anaerohalosphaeraceae bacterium]HPP57431.1 sigma-70 family RNA polymerase sigma factor [Anaerohalosphaeraceae bacterium]